MRASCWCEGCRRMQSGRVALAAVCLALLLALAAGEGGNDVDLRWRFLYGENMHPGYLEQRGIAVQDRRRAVLLAPGESADMCYADAPPKVNDEGRPEREAWRLAMAGGLPFADPGFATVHIVMTEADPAENGPFLWESRGGHVHGVAVLLSRGDSAKLDRTDGMTVFSSNSKKSDVRLRLYRDDVRPAEDEEISAVVHHAPPSQQAVPSHRHLQALLDAAEAAGLEEQYMSRTLLGFAYYTAPSFIKKRREETLRAPRDMPKVSLEELQAHDGTAGPHYVSCMGYVVATRPIFSSWAGRDVTKAVLSFYDGAQLAVASQDLGLPPYPDLMTLPDRKVEYLLHNLDSLMSMANAEVVGVLTEFWDDQEDAIYYDLDELDYLHNLQVREVEEEE